MACDIVRRRTIRSLIPATSLPDEAGASCFLKVTSHSFDHTSSAPSCVFLKVATLTVAGGIRKGSKKEPANAGCGVFEEPLSSFLPSTPLFAVRCGDQLDESETESTSSSSAHPGLAYPNTFGEDDGLDLLECSEDMEADLDSPCIDDCNIVILSLMLPDAGMSSEVETRL